MRNRFTQRLIQNDLRDISEVLCQDKLRTEILITIWFCANDIRTGELARQDRIPLHVAASARRDGPVRHPNSLTHSLPHAAAQFNSVHLLSSESLPAENSDRVDIGCRYDNLGSHMKVQQRLLKRRRLPADGVLLALKLFITAHNALMEHHDLIMAYNHT